MPYGGGAPARATLATGPGVVTPAMIVAAALELYGSAKEMVMVKVKVVVCRRTVNEGKGGEDPRLVACAQYSEHHRSSQRNPTPAPKPS